MNIFPKFDKRFLYTWIAILTIIFNLYPIWAVFGIYYHNHYFVPDKIRNSYIAEIKGDLLDVELTKKHLDNFNELGHNNILRYEVTESPRPIYIEIRALGKDFYEEVYKDSILAYAQATDKDCRIILRNDMHTEEEFRNTLIHEFLHCYYYDHSPNESDLMYWEENSFVNLEPSIRKYAKELEERLK